MSTWRDLRAARRLLERRDATTAQTRRLAVRDPKLSASGEPSGGVTDRHDPDRQLRCGAASGTRHDRRAAEAAQLGRPPHEGGQRGGMAYDNSDDEFELEEEHDDDALDALSVEQIIHPA